MRWFMAKRVDVYAGRRVSDRHSGASAAWKSVVEHIGDIPATGTRSKRLDRLRFGWFGSDVLWW